jgi:transcriptional regulator with XRE-family HTH domain
MVRGKADPSLGTVIRQAREDAGLSQVQLAANSGLALGTVARVEAGQSDPSWSSVRAIADTLNLSLVQLGRQVESEEGR